jgi:TatD DNase family protein
MGILEKNKEMIVGGVVHSFDGTLEEALTAVDFGLYIGINGCSLKTEENLAVVKQLPLEKLMIETDSPWCDIRPSHTSYKYVQTQFSSKKKEKWEQGTSIKGRNEPRNIMYDYNIASNKSS